MNEGNKRELSEIAGGSNLPAVPSDLTVNVTDTIGRTGTVIMRPLTTGMMMYIDTLHTKDNGEVAGDDSADHLRFSIIDCKGELFESTPLYEDHTVYGKKYTVPTRDWLMTINWSVYQKLVEVAAELSGATLKDESSYDFTSAASASKAD